ncbi:hypothetical protein CAK95_24680 [Pseudorhodoplanes sinuspersici]|uniref:Peptidase M23 domain-containing protein n=1 Tax=Pseudorhodoplanes sinuspersici TaxID=1235591 RepID=A0A1W6ZXD4_9HYPH|nr:hypothetical protein CAK95_24680 [Pseudorhodoplanes sinuspersici]
MERGLRILVAGLFLAFAVGTAAAETWPAPQTTMFKPDWEAARAAVPALPRKAESTDRLAELTQIVSGVFPALANSPVPVLLPFPVADYARDHAAGSSTDGDYSEFKPTKFFLAGPTGYDAAFSVRTRDVADFADINFRDPVVVQISGFNMLYDLPPAKGVIVQKPGEIERDSPGIRRQILESTLRYSFERFGVPYVISIQCFDGPQRRNRLSCRNADRIAGRFLRALQLVGGNPDAETDAPAPAVIRPEQSSSVFTYHRVGALLPGTAMRSNTGDADKTVYARIRFPTAATPAYVNSQSFMHGGDCNQTGRRRVSPGYRCRINSKPLFRDESAPENYSYPWRDNFCENRHFFVGQCAAGLGHQGQDIRPASCATKDTNKTRCQPYRHGVVAARDGMILREAWNDSFFLVVNAPGERIRFRHLHMHPRKLDDDGIVSGHLVKEGEPLGMIGNYNRRPGWTTTHLHFEVLVPTRDGWVRVNPYMTLVAAYEQLIRARGTEINEPPSDTPADTSIEGASEAIAASAAAPITAKDTNTARSKTKAAPRTKVKTKSHKVRSKAPRRIAHPGKMRTKKRR